MARTGGGRDPNTYESTEGRAQVGTVPWPWLVTSVCCEPARGRGFEGDEAEDGGQSEEDAPGGVHFPLCSPHLGGPTEEERVNMAPTPDNGHHTIYRLIYLRSSHRPCRRLHSQATMQTSVA